jgi:AcrR family transcriptional regulator
MPKLWTDTIEAHRKAVREAALDAAAALLGEHGLTGVTMSAIAETSGIGRATLYKYFPDIDAVLLAWHERQIGSHLNSLETIAGEAGAPSHRLEAVLTGYAMLAHGHGGGEIGGGEIASLLHRGAHLATAQTRLTAFVAALIEQGQQLGEVRSDVPAAELASYCLHALGAAGASQSLKVTHRLVAVILAGLRPPSA